MQIGKYHFDLEKNSYIMGILNVTPDSFSDGGVYFGKEASAEDGSSGTGSANLDRIFRRVEEMIREGASIIDIGGESSRPGHRKIRDEEEMDRVIPVIEALRHRFDIALSLDTCKYEVARAGLEAGADMINDIWGLKWDDRLAPLLAKYPDRACCLMHNRKDPDYRDFLHDFCLDMEETLQIADAAGISRDRIILDPGIGFAKDYQQNLFLLKNLEIMTRWKLPVLLGTSRKSVIGKALDLPVDQREEGTAATTVLGRMKGASVFRVHDVRTNCRALRMIDQIMNAEDGSREPR